MSFRKKVLVGQVPARTERHVLIWRNFLIIISAITKKYKRYLRSLRRSVRITRMSFALRPLHEYIRARFPHFTTDRVKYHAIRLAKQKQVHAMLAVVFVMVVVIYIPTQNKKLCLGGDIYIHTK